MFSKKKVFRLQKPLFSYLKVYSYKIYMLIKLKNAIQC